MPQGIKWIMDTRSNYLLVRALGHLNDNTLQCDHLPIRKFLPKNKTIAKDGFKFASKKQLTSKSYSKDFEFMSK